MRSVTTASLCHQLVARKGPRQSLWHCPSCGVLFRVKGQPTGNRHKRGCHMRWR